MMIGYKVNYYNNIIYTYNRALAYRLAEKAQTEVRKVSTKEVKKAIDISI